MKTEEVYFFMSARRNHGQPAPVWASQNYLTSKRIINTLITKTNIKLDDYIIEIGPGKGHITGALLDYCGKLSAIEIDKQLYDRLLPKFKANDRLKLFNIDFLKWNLPSNGKYKVFSNIPFSHTTAIMRKLTDWHNPPTEAWLIVV